MSKNFDSIVPKNAKLEELGKGYQTAEGPVWIAAEDCLIFSDIRGNHMRKWSAKNGITTFRFPSNKANGNALDKQGRLITCEHANWRIVRTEADGSIVPIATHYQGKRLNSPNDVVVKSDGSIYFTDPPYGLTATGGTERQQELAYFGVYRLFPDGKTITLLVDDFVRPNGLVFSLDESLLYINDTEKAQIRVFDVQKDGTITNGRIFVGESVLAESVSGKLGKPDGMKVDIEGNVYCTGPGGIWVFDSTGEHLGTISVQEKVANMAWGESDWKTLFIASHTSLYRMRMNVAGIPIP